MIIEFKLGNYRSFKSTQSLSMVASSDGTYADSHLIATNNRSIPSLLRSAVVFGPNAGGKTNLVNALTFFRNMVLESATSVKPGQELNVRPFLLDRTLINEPSELEITFLHEGVRYQYGFKLTSKRVVEEWLLVYKTFKPQMWFSRTYDKKLDEEKYSFGPSFRGEKTRWQELTRPNSLYLSTAVQWNSEQLIPIFQYIAENIVVYPSGTLLSTQFTINALEDISAKKQVIDFMNSADIGISDIEVEERKGFQSRVNLSPTDGSAEVETTKAEFKVPKFLHETNNGTALFEMQDESLGTQKLFGLAGPVLDILKNNKVLIVDELDTSIHTLLLKYLVNLFHNSAHDAQLIFTSHNTELLNGPFLRRDQIWFVEKDKAQSSVLYPLLDFKPRKGEAIERGYLTGKYGALPFLNVATN